MILSSSPYDSIFPPLCQNAFSEFFLLTIRARYLSHVIPCWTSRSCWSFSLSRFPLSVLLPCDGLREEICFFAAGWNNNCRRLAPPQALFPLFFPRLSWTAVPLSFLGQNGCLFPMVTGWQETSVLHRTRCFSSARGLRSSGHGGCPLLSSISSEFFPLFSSLTLLRRFRKHDVDSRYHHRLLIRNLVFDLQGCAGDWQLFFVFFVIHSFSPSRTEILPPPHPLFCPFLFPDSDTLFFPAVVASSHCPVIWLYCSFPL